MDPVALLIELLAIPSSSGEEDAVAHYLSQRVGTLSYRTHRDAVDNAHGTMGVPSAKRTFVLMDHMDTVPG
jgi:LysW-gamma-L-lysine carboxypeptidase